MPLISRFSFQNVGDRPKRLYISRYRNSSNYYQATWLETDTDQYDIPEADIGKWIFVFNH